MLSKLRLVRINVGIPDNNFKTLISLSEWTESPFVLSMTRQPVTPFFEQAIPNVNGIVKYEVSRAVDHDGGRSLNVPGSWSNVDDFQVSSSSTCSRPPLHIQQSHHTSHWHN